MIVMRNKIALALLIAFMIATTILTFNALKGIDLNGDPFATEFDDE